jgi:hypothetical protein
MRRFPCPLFLATILAGLLAAAPAVAQWSADVLDPSTVDRNATGAVVPAIDLAAADGQPQNLNLFPMAGTPPPPAESLAQYYVFVTNGQTLADWPTQVRGRIGLVRVSNGVPTLFGQVANNAALAGAVAVLLISNTTNPTAVAGTIPAANIKVADGNLLVGLMDPTTDATDPPNGTISVFPIRINPVLRPIGPPVPVPQTLTSGAYHGTRIPAGVTPDFDGNPNALVPFAGPALVTATYPVGREAAEPTLGVNRNGTGFFAAATFDSVAAGTLPRTVVMRSRDGGRTWEGVSPPLPEPLQSEPPVNGDPMVYVDPDHGEAGRVFSLDTYDAAGMWLIFSDDEGETWGRNPVVLDPGVTDHQTIFSGPPTPELAPLVDLLYGKVVYVCYNTVATSPCVRSLDGGQTFTKAGLPYVGLEPHNPNADPGGSFGFFGVPGLCGGLTAHVRTDRDGRVFLPAGRCAVPAISISEDGGLTWSEVFVSSSVQFPHTAQDPAPGLDNDFEHENPVAVDAAGNLYMVWWDHNDRLPYLTISRDHGRTWSAPLMVGPPGVQEVNFPTLDAGDAGRIVIHFPGTVVGDRSDPLRPWNLYDVVSTNALDADPLFVFATGNDPAQPIHRGPCLGRCAGMFDFLDVVVAPDGVPEASQGFWGAAVDTCDPACEQHDDAAASAMDGIVVRQLGGPALRARPIRIEDTDPAIEYKGGWHQVDTAAASGGAYHRRVGSKNGTGASPTARLVFGGDAITYYYATSSAGGTADVSIDGNLLRTVSFAGSTNEPAFGASVRFDDLGEGQHEITIAYRTGIAYLDAFEIAPASAAAQADASAPQSRSVTTVSPALLSGLPGAATTATVVADLTTREISVVVEGSANPLSVKLLGPSGGVAGVGGALLSGTGISGLDALAAVPGVYTVQVVDQVGGAGAVKVSIARTVATP